MARLKKTETEKKVLSDLDKLKKLIKSKNIDIFDLDKIIEKEKKRRGKNEIDKLNREIEERKKKIVVIEAMIIE